MNRRSRIAMIAALVLALVGVTAVLLMSGGTRTAQAAVQHVNRQVTHHATHHAQRHAAATSTEQAGGTDGDTVQSGDQTGADSTPGETTGTSESSVESEQGQPGEPAGGHQDTGANTQNDCTGNCVQ
jgi:type II secretory pathway pseudopilin PulG